MYLHRSAIAALCISAFINHPNFIKFSYGIYLKVSLENLIQPPGEHREHHLGDVRPKKLKLYTKFL